MIRGFICLGVAFTVACGGGAKSSVESAPATTTPTGSETTAPTKTGAEPASDEAVSENIEPNQPPAQKPVGEVVVTWGEQHIASDGQSGQTAMKFLHSAEEVIRACGEQHVPTSVATLEVTLGVDLGSQYDDSAFVKAMVLPRGTPVSDCISAAFATLALGFSLNEQEWLYTTFSVGTSDAKPAPAPDPPDYRSELELLCDGLALSGADQLDEPSARTRTLVAWLDGRLRHPNMHAALNSTAQQQPGQKLAAWKKRLRGVGLDPAKCAFLD